MKSLKPFKSQFTTFYSYKGGVGRTSALVNSALLRAVAGDRVLVIDFDLEAPGLASYVKEISQSNSEKNPLHGRPGILEYFYDAINSEKVPELKPMAVSGKQLGLDISGEIWFIGAGNSDSPEYSKKLSSLDWVKIFEEQQGSMMLENFKRQVAAEFENPDYVFIDSRTGMTEIGGVCTNYLSDLVVVMASLNDQNLMGTARVLDSFKKFKIKFMLVASNVPVGLPWGENQMYQDRINEFNECLGSEPNMLIYHYPSLSLKEYVPASFKLKKKKAVLKDDPLLRSYENLTKRINGRNPHSFENFMSNEMGHFLLHSFDDNNAKDYFNYFEKYYGHRKKQLNATKAIYEVRKYLIEEDFSPAKTFFKDLRTVFESSDTFEGLSTMKFLRRFTLDSVSDEILKTYATTPEKLGDPEEWFYAIPKTGKIEIIERLFGRAEYKTILKIVPKNDREPFFHFTRGICEERLDRKKQAYDSFSEFIKVTGGSPERIDDPGHAFAFGYAAAFTNNLDLAKSALKRSEVLTDFADDEPVAFFMPTKFHHTEDMEEFRSELENFSSFVDTL